MEQEVFRSGEGMMPASLNDQHLACVLLLDTSTSMEDGNAIGLLNDAVNTFRVQCKQDDALMRGLDIAVVSFASDVNILQQFVPIAHMEIPRLEANGQTAMGAGIDLALDLVEQRKADYKDLGVPYHRPWIFMITDGAPNDDYEPAFARLKEMQELKKVEMWAVGVPGFDKEILLSLTERVIALDNNLNFAGLFEWLSTSLSVKTNSKPTDGVKYSNLPDGSSVVPPDSWGRP